jgi:DNA polymerase-3 subunit beta
MQVMKIECVKDRLTEAVLRTEKVSSKSATLPVLKCLLFSADKGLLQIRSTNLDVGVECTVPVKVDTAGSIAIPGGVLASFLTNLGENKSVTIETTAGGVTVSSDKTKTTLHILDKEDFPELPKVENPTTFEIATGDFVGGLKSVWYASATTSIKPELSSVRIYKEKEGNLVFVATDGFRLAEKKIKVVNIPDFEHILIPVKNVGEIIKLLDGEEKSIQISIDQGLIEIVSGSSRIVSRTIDGVFPDYQAIIPKEFVTEAKLLKQDLLNTLRLTNLFSDSFNQVGFEVKASDKQLIVTSKNKDLGDHESHLDIKVTGEDIKVQFNFKYLTDCLSSVKSEGVEFCFAGKQRPIVVKGGSDTTFLYLMMPMNG